MSRNGWHEYLVPNLELHGMLFPDGNNRLWASAFRKSVFAPLHQLDSMCVGYTAAEAYHHAFGYAGQSVYRCRWTFLQQLCCTHCRHCDGARNMPISTHVHVMCTQCMGKNLLQCAGNITNQPCSTHTKLNSSLSHLPGQLLDLRNE